jgi:hypothetical protein
MLPDEEAACGAIRDGLRGEIEGLSELLRTGVTLLTGSGTRGTWTPGVADVTIQVAFGLFVKVCKQARAIQMLCERGFGQDALALTRNLFEVVLALAFVLRPRLRVKMCSNPLPRTKGKPFGSRFRARLYLANIALEKERTLKEFERTKGLRNIAKSLDRTAILLDVAAAESAIGREWAARLKDRKT